MKLDHLSVVREAEQIMIIHITFNSHELLLHEHGNDHLHVHFKVLLLKVKGHQLSLLCYHS